MKSTIRNIGLSVLAVVAFTVQANAQSRSTKKTTTTTTTTTRSNAKTSRVVKRSNVQYKTPKKKVVTYRKIPSKSKTVTVRNNNNTYQYDNNRFYRSYNGRYIAVAPKPGVRISRLPVGYRTIRHGGRSYFNFGGIFYISINNQYEVVQPEVGTIVYELPNDAEKVIIEDQVLYEYNDVIYERIQYDGTRAYEVVGFIE
ncbi:hypothetical protein KO500_07540 [Cellulophaga baltica]|uniref:DUF6515 family protein n=1 Tax=Cellulophaga TaxID=104264 RepID=UPI001C072F3C|nr:MULTISPECIES: DUF6515 family protein [Cellulophaga]MBU2996282.1 hypothetical protein [Cellulophaga baltica]MDO6767677.1 DUF6515 family protein [Cellulophaga sp. 1_MG-2023]